MTNLRIRLADTRHMFVCYWFSLAQLNLAVFYAYNKTTADCK